MNSTTHDSPRPGQTVHSQSAPQGVAEAALQLNGVLAGEPDMPIRLGVIEALTVLYQAAVPPYPPLPEPATPIDAAQGIPAALAALEQTVTSYPGTEVVMRAARAARVLTSLAPLDHTAGQ